MSQGHPVNTSVHPRIFNNKFYTQHSKHLARPDPIATCP